MLTGNIIPRILIVTSTGIPRQRIDELVNDFEGRAEFVVAEDTEESLMEKIRGVHAMIACPRPLFTAKLLERAGENLTWIHVPGAGVEEFLIPELVDNHITLTNGKIIQGPSVSDHAMALLLSLSCNLNYVLRNQTSDMPRPIELRGKTALVIGCGGIGQSIAERAFAFGMTVRGVTADYVPMLRMWDRLFPPHFLNEALPEADAVLIAVASTDQTRKMFGKKQFEIMKESSYLINVARGGIVDTEALVEALRQKQIAGAGLDVTEPEPLPEDHPLRAMVNVVLTPHIAGPSDKNRTRSFELIRNNIERFLFQRPFVNLVNKKLGY